MDASESNSLNTLLNRLFTDGYQRLCFSVRSMAPCQVLGLAHNVSILEEGVVEILITAIVHHSAPPPPPRRISRSRSASSESHFSAHSAPMYSTSTSRRDSSAGDHDGGSVTPEFSRAYQERLRALSHDSNDYHQSVAAGEAPTFDQGDND